MRVFQGQELQKRSRAKRSSLLATGAIGLSLSVLGLGLVACGQGDEPGKAEASGGGPINVVASTTQICDYVTQLDIPQVDLTCLLSPNATAHELEMTHEQMTKTSKADLLLVNGVDLEHFLDSAIESSGFSGTMVVTSGILTADDVDGSSQAGESAELEKSENGNYTIDRGVAKVDVAPWPFPPENPGEQAEFRYDPHVWTSPKNAKVQVTNIGNALEKVADDRGDQELKADIAEHVNSYETKLDKLDAWAHQSIDSVDNPVLFTSHDAFGYFSKEFGINFIGAALSDFNSQQDATAEHIAAAAKTVKDSGATALFAENSNNAKSIEAIAKAAGVKAIVGDDALYGDSLGPAGSAGDTYIDSIIHNVTTVVKAWDGAVADLPQGIK